MQGRLLDKMSKFTKIGVATPKYQIQNNSKHVRMRNAKYWVPQGQENEQFPSQGKRIHCSLIYFLSKLSIIRL